MIDCCRTSRTNPSIWGSFDAFLRHKRRIQVETVVRPLAERLREDGLKMWPVAPKPSDGRGFEKWVLKPGDSIPA